MRSPEFVTRKISLAVARIKYGKQNELVLGNLDARRDWGMSSDFVDCYWRMLQQDKPDDYVVATGEHHSVEEFVRTAFDYVGLDYRKYLKVSSIYERPAEVEILCGNYTKALNNLGWQPLVHFNELVRIMVDADMKRVKDGIC
jgi:GDPmannose 4,6-dehydratase